jgi:hypothetical protein
VSMSDELKEHNILKLILILKFACATLELGHSIHDLFSHDVMEMCRGTARFPLATEYNRETFVHVSKNSNSEE